MAATAIISADADVGHGTRVGHYCLLGLDGPPDAKPLELGPDAVLRSHTVIYRGVTAGHRFSTGHGVLIRELCAIGSDVSIGTHSVVEHHVVMGDRVRLHSQCFVPEMSVLEDDAWLGPGVRVTNARYPNRPDTKERLEGVRIEQGAVVGAAAVLLPGVTIGAGALIGAGAVVTRDVRPGTRIVGNPGRILN